MKTIIDRSLRNWWVWLLVLAVLALLDALR